MHFGSLFQGSKSCLWRIHGQPGKKIAISVTIFSDMNQVDGIWYFFGLHDIDTDGGHKIKLPKRKFRNILFYELYLLKLLFLVLTLKYFAVQSDNKIDEINDFPFLRSFFLIKNPKIACF